MDWAQTKKLSTSGIATSKCALLLGIQIGMDGTNDATITVYNGTDNSGDEIIPTNTYDAATLGIQGLVSSYGKLATDGIYVEITCAGTVEVVVDFKPWP